MPSQKLLINSMGFALSFLIVFLRGPIMSFLSRLFTSARAEEQKLTQQIAADLAKAHARINILEDAFHAQTDSTVTYVKNEIARLEAKLPNL